MKFTKLIIITQIDPFYTLSFLKELFYLIKNDKKLKSMNIKIFNLPNFNESKFSNFKRFFNLYGFFDTFKLVSKYFIAVYFLKQIKVFKKYCKLNNIEFISATNIEDIFIDSKVDNLNKCVLSLSSPQIFKKNILSLKNIKFLNIHCAPLPSYKGMMPNFWQTFNEEYSSGISLHEIDERIDTGKVISSFNYPLIRTTSLHNKMIMAKLYSAHIFYNYLNNIEGLQKIKIKNKYYRFPTKQDGLIFKTKNKFI